MSATATKVAGQRLVRKSGAYRQSHYVENRNRSLRQRTPIAVSFEDDNSDASTCVDGRLKVVTQRNFTACVPFEMSEGRFSYEDAPNPINQTGPLLAEQIPVVTSNDFESFLAAFNKRCNFDQLKDGDDIEDDVFAEACDLIEAIPDNLFTEWEESPEDVTRWLDKFATAKQTRMKKAEENIPWCTSRYLGTKDLSVKLEVLLKRQDPSWAPRVIYAGNDEFNRVTGPAMMIVMERLVMLFAAHPIGDVEVKLAYKTNDVSLVEFLDVPELPDAYEGDFSANDREQRSRVALLFDLWLKKLCMPQWLRNLMLEMTCFKVQNKRFGVTGEIRFQLPTGTTATTPRNSTYNPTMFAVACRRQRVPRARACILGDDILAVMKFLFSVSLWKECVDRFKMKLKGKNPKLIGESTLLSRRLIIHGETRCMIPLIGKAIARFNACALVLDTPNSWHKYMAGKSLSYAYEFRHVPFLCNYYLQRFALEEQYLDKNKDKLVLDDLTWFTRSSGMDLSQIMVAIREEKVIVSDDVFLDWLMEHYDLGLCELTDLYEMTVLSNETPTYIEHYAVDNLTRDW